MNWLTAYSSFLLQLLRTNGYNLLSIARDEARRQKKTESGWLFTCSYTMRLLLQLHFWMWCFCLCHSHIINNILTPWPKYFLKNWHLFVTFGAFFFFLWPTKNIKFSEFPRYSSLVGSLLQDTNSFILWLHYIFWYFFSSSSEIIKWDDFFPKSKFNQDTWYVVLLVSCNFFTVPLGHKR